MRNINPDDRRYMTFEQRAADDPRYRGKVESRVPAIETCYCGKTVVKVKGHANGVECPRNCEANREVDLVGEMERYERRAADMRFSSELRARAAMRAAAIRRRIG